MQRTAKKKFQWRPKLARARRSTRLTASGPRLTCGLSIAFWLNQLCAPFVMKDSGPGLTCSWLMSLEGTLWGTLVLLNGAKPFLGRDDRVLDLAGKGTVI